MRLGEPSGGNRVDPVQQGAGDFLAVAVHQGLVGREEVVDRAKWEGERKGKGKNREIKKKMAW